MKTTLYCTGSSISSWRIFSSKDFLFCSCRGGFRTTPFMLLFLSSSSFSFMKQKRQRTTIVLQAIIRRLRLLLIVNVLLQESSTVQFQLTASAMMSPKPLQRAASYVIGTSGSSKTATLVVSLGSVVDFYYEKNPTKSAIVNAANEVCLGGGGVDGAISNAGGITLADDRMKLPIVKNPSIRCPMGEAKVTGPNTYGTLHVPYIIHSVGPNYWDFEEAHADADEHLHAAYTNSLRCGKAHGLEAIGFSLISSGVYKGTRTKKQVLQVGVEATIEFVESITDKNDYDELKEIHFCAFTDNEANVLKSIAEEMKLHPSSEHTTGKEDDTQGENMTGKEDDTQDENVTDEEENKE